MSLGCPNLVVIKGYPKEEEKHFAGLFKQVYSSNTVSGGIGMLIIWF